MSLLIALASLFFALDPSGHWEGIVATQMGTIKIALDLGKTDEGKPTGTFSAPERHLNGLPLLTIAVNDTTVSFEPAAIGAKFKGDFSADGKSIEGTFESAAGAVPVTLTRNGEAHITPAPKNAAVSKELEGQWIGTLHVDGGKRLLFKIANQPGNTAAASIVSLDEGRLELPIAITEKGSDVTVTASIVGSSYAATFNADHTELVGMYTTGEGFDFPLTLKRATAGDAKR